MRIPLCKIGLIRLSVFYTTTYSSRWTFIDGDYLPLCNLEVELRPMIEQGQFISTEDGANTWNQTHEEAMGVRPGTYVNINAGFISLDMEVYGAIMHEWRNLMTRRKPFDLWYGDQGALNAILDKWSVKKHTLNKVLWNQTWLNESMAKRKCPCKLIQAQDALCLWHEPSSARIPWAGMERAGTNSGTNWELITSGKTMRRKESAFQSSARANPPRQLCKYLSGFYFSTSSIVP